MSLSSTSGKRIVNKSNHLPSSFFFASDFFLNSTDVDPVNSVESDFCLGSHARCAFWCFSNESLSSNFVSHRSQ